MDDHSIPARIREVRKAKGFTLKEVAARIGGGVNFATIGRLERGERNLTWEWVKLIARALDVTPGELISAEGGPSTTNLPLFSLNYETDPGNPDDRASLTKYVNVNVVSWSEQSYVTPRCELPEGVLVGLEKALFLFDWVIIDPLVTHLEEGELYILKSDRDGLVGRVFRERPPRFVPFSGEPSAKTYVLPRDDAKVIGRIAAPAVGIRVPLEALAETDPDGD